MAGMAAGIGPPATGGAGPPAVPAKPAGPTFMEITDGTSNTILVVEANREIPWTKPEDIPFDPNGPLPDLGGFWPDGFNAAFGDGSVRSLKKSINPKVLKALITKDGGEVISSDQY
jgi:prepilin-type processing-associated H-X9-DG protein